MAVSLGVSSGVSSSFQARTWSRGARWSSVRSVSDGALSRRIAAASQSRRTPNARKGPLVRVEATISLRGLTEVDINTYDAALEAAGNRLVVLDMYTQWCGPCKLLAPKVEALAQKYQGVVFLKLDCNETNKPLAKSLGVRAVPTFKIIQNKEIVAQIQGAKFDELVEAIVSRLTGPPSASPPPSTSPSVVVPGKVVEVGKETFYTALREAGERLVVLDMFTDWCGPCKLLAPKVEQLALENEDIVFLKLNCNEDNKTLAKGLGVVSVPTVKFYRSKEFLDEVRGNKYELIVETIDKLR